MKKTLLLFGAFLLFMSAGFSQAPIFSEDFSAGIPAGWVNSGTATGGVTVANMWKAANKTGGAYSSGDVLASPSGIPFALFDSDSLDNGGLPNNFGNGAAPGPQRGYLTTPSINCTGHSRVLLQFYEMYSCYGGNSRVVVKAGGNSDTIEVNPLFNFTFAEIKNPTFKQFDISSIAANQSNVTVTFLWDDGFYYYWGVDDVSVIDAPVNDLAISRAGSFDYYSYPWNQLDSIFFYARVTNLGQVNQPNSRATIEIKKGATTAFVDSTPTGITLAPGIDSALVGNGVWAPAFTLPAGVGVFPQATYTSIVKTFSDSTDALPFDNIDTSTFVVSDSVYAIDNGVYGGSFPVYSGTTAYEWANVFQTKVADTLTSITTAFDGVFSNFTSTAGPTAQIKIYSLDPNSANLTATQILTTETKKLTTSSFPNGIGIKPISFKVDITSGNPVLQPGYYGISVITPSADSALYLVNSVKKVAGSLSGEFAGGQPSAFYSNTQFFLRMNFGHGLNTLWCNFTRNPATTPLHVGQIVTFTGTSDGTPTATYAWTVSGLTTGITKNGVGKIWKDTLSLDDIDSIQVCLTVTDGNTTASTCKVVRVRDIQTGVTEVSALASTSLVPNPTTGLVTISTDNVNGALSIGITNLLGETVKTFNETAGGSFSKSYNLSDLSSGVYIVKIQNGDNSATKRLSISK